MATKNRIHVAIVGIGAIGQRYLQLLDQLPQYKLLAVCDLQATENCKVPIYTDLKSLLAAHSSLQLLIVCSPNGLHCLHATLALNAGCNVLCEKPLAIRSQDALLMMETAQKQQRQLFCVMQNRFSPAAKWLKSLIDQAVLGKIFMIQVNCLWNRGESYYKNSAWRGSLQLDGGTLFTQFSHFVDLLLWLFGPLTIEHARFNNFTHTDVIQFEDSGTVLFTTNQQSEGVFSFSTAVAHQNFESSITIIAQNGTITLGGQYMDKIEYCSIQALSVPIFMPVANNHLRLLENVADVLLHDAPLEIATEDGVKVVQTIEQMYNKAIFQND